MVPNSAAHPAFRATHYDVMATLTPATQMLTAHATVDFVATDSSSTVLFELHPNLHVTAVTNAAGKQQTFQRLDKNSLQMRVDLDSAVAVGQKVTLNFDYAGPLSNEENSPAPGTRLASINADGAYLLLPARWFPLTNYPVNRYTGVYKIQVPEAFTVAGTGKAGPPQLVTKLPSWMPTESKFRFTLSRLPQRPRNFSEETWEQSFRISPMISAR